MTDFAIDPVIQSLTHKLADWPLSSKALNSSTLKAAAFAASSTDTFADVRALPMMSPKWSSRFMAQIFTECQFTVQSRKLAPLPILSRAIIMIQRR